MSDSHGAGLPNETAINTAGVSVSVILTILFVPLCMVIVYGYFMKGMAAEIDAKALAGPAGELAAAKAEWAEARDGYGVVDTASGRYQIPVSEAKKLFVVDAKSQREAAIAAAKAAEEAALMQEGEGTPGEESEQAAPDGGASD